MASPPAAPQNDAPAFWSATSATDQVFWNASDLLVKDAGGKTIFSAKAVAEKGFRAYQAEMEQDSVGRCTYRRRFRLLASVGTLLTFQDQLETSCDSEAHPGYLSRYTTIDLSKLDLSKVDLPSLPGYQPSEGNDFSLAKETPPAVVSLRSLFPEAQLLKSLNADPILKKALASPAASLDDLKEAIGDDGVEVTGKPCHFRLDSDYLTRFAFHHIEQGKIAVRLQMTPIGGACASQSADLGLLLPIPNQLQESLTRAASAKEGFLSIHAPGRNEFTVLTFHNQTGHTGPDKKNQGH